VINCILGYNMHLNLALDHLIRMIKELLSRIGNFSSCHIFKELNVTVDGLFESTTNSPVGP
jgi:hypothetical protein